jgi:hypoxanthine phosphoribosyltransferase
MQLVTLIDEDTLRDRVRTLGARIRADHGDAPILFIGVLKGSFVFLADLVRAVDGPVEITFLGVSSYEGTETTGVVRITHDITTDLTGKNVVVVEDIVDTGLTLAFLRKSLAVRNPASLRVATLLDKPARRRVPVEVEYTGFTIEDRFVIGYGLDYDQFYRNLPFVGELVG